MPKINSIANLRASLGDYASGYSDEELLKAVADSSGTPIDKAATQLGYDTAKSPWAEKGSSAIDAYQSSLYGVGEAAASAVGADSVSAFMGRRRRANDIASSISSARATEGGIPDDWRQVDGVGSAARYVGGLALSSAPYIGEAAIGGPIGRMALRGGTGVAELIRGGATAEEVAAAAARSNRNSVLGATAASYPSSVGQVLGAQRDQNGQTDLGVAAALGVPYAALNGLFGVEHVVANTALPRTISPVLDGITGIKGRFARAGWTGVEQAVGEGASETLQSGLEQLGRMSVDERETFWNEEAKKRYIDSFVGGGALGFAFGAGLSGGRRSGHPAGAMDATGDPTANESSSDLLAPVPRLGFDPNVVGSGGTVDNNAMHVFPDGSTALNSEAAFERRYAPQRADTPAGAIDFESPDLLAQPRRDFDPEVPGLRFDPASELELAPQEALPQRQVSEGTPFVDPSMQLSDQDSFNAKYRSNPDNQVAAAPAPQATPAQTTDQRGGEQALGARPSPDVFERMNETRARKQVATEAIQRAAEAGMVSEKQQVAFWRAEELEKEGRLTDSKMTQVTALLMQSKFGQVKTMLDEAAAGALDDNGKAQVKEVSRTLEQIDKERAKVVEQRAEILGTRDRAPSQKTPAGARYLELGDHLAELDAEKRKVVDHASKQAGLPASDPSPQQAQPSAPAATPASTPTQKTAASVKSATEVANKIKRYESLLQCLRR